MDKLITYLNQSPTVFFILKKKNNAWELEYVTQNVKNIYGFSADDFISKKVKHEDFIFTEDLKKFRQEAGNISKIIADEYIYEPYRILSNDKTVWVKHSTKIIRDKNGNRSHYYGYLTDITHEKELYNKLELTDNILDSIFNNSFHFITLLDNKGNVIKSNKTSTDILGIKEIDVLGRAFWDCPWWKNREQIDEIKEDVALILEGKKVNNSKFYYDLIGNKIYLDFTFTPIIKNGKVLYIICEGHDITKIEIKRKNLEQYVKIVNENVFITISDKKGIISDISDAYCKFTGYTREELKGKKHNIFKHPDNDSYIFKELWNTITKGKIWKGEHLNIKKDDTPYWVENSITPNFDEDKNIIGYTSIYNDITDKKEISELLITDYLTKIYNRRHFNTIFNLEFKRSKRHRNNLVLMILDIDFFKQYNDTYGHSAGDTTLKSVAQALNYTLKRPEDFIFRLGGEEFGIITSDIDKDGVLKLASRLRESILDLKIKHINSSVNEYLTISIGIKIVESKSSLPTGDIYKLADEALYKAKERGRNKSIICTREQLAEDILL